jgi:hypothetical protein
MELTVGEVYDFVAYSYNSIGQLDDISISATVDGIPTATADLLWDRVDNQTFTYFHPLSLTLTHRFMRFRKVAQTQQGTVEGKSYVITTIGLNTHSTGDLTVSDGAVATSGTVGSLTLTYPNYQIAYPVQPTTGTVAFTATISGTLDGTPFNDKTVSFRAALKYNGSYTLGATIKRGIPWAGSNIYWVDTPEDGPDTGYLTFAPAGTPFDDERQMYMGVNFKWGSLVGVSPANSAFASTYVYVPDDAQSPPTWTKKKGSDTEWNDYTDVPSLVGVTVNDIGTGTYSFNGFNTATYYQAMQGDICRYIDGNYRMPTNIECIWGTIDGENTINYTQQNWQNTSTPNTDGWWSQIAGSDWEEVTITEADGTQIMTSGGNYSNYTRFPAWGMSGSRYWTATAAYDALTSTEFYVRSANYGSVLNATRASIFFIRCLRNYDNRN